MSASGSQKESDMDVKARRGNHANVLFSYLIVVVSLTTVHLLVIFFSHFLLTSRTDSWNILVLLSCPKTLEQS